MKQNRKTNIKKEKIIMFTSSAFVLAALTMTGIYIKNKNVESKEDGYSIDFAALEKDARDNIAELSPQGMSDFEKEIDSLLGSIEQPAVTEDDLDYLPMEVGSSTITIPELETPKPQEPEEEKKEETAGESLEVQEQEPIEEQATATAPAPHYSEETNLVRPVAGDILMHYSMDGSIYFATLDQYKYNPAVIFSAKEGTAVSACAEGIVTKIYNDAEIGQAITIDLGNGYQATYGQIRDIGVSENSYVEAGDVLGFVAAPTKYYCNEGSNLYFKMTKDGASMNPESLFK